MDFTSSPNYLKGADLHNIGAGNPSFFDDPLAAAGGLAASAVESVTNSPKFALTSIASGINSIYNSAITVGNWLGVTDVQENDLGQTLNGYDSDLGRYYDANKSAIDLTGFVVTSLVPGVGGVKLFNAGQKVLATSLKTGSVGRNIAESTGLIRTVTAEGKTLTQLAGEGLAQSQQSFNLMNAGVLKAIGSGFAQATWESAAFETFVAATMFRSPVLEDQDFKDLSLNILTGAALGGVIGGVVSSAGVYGGIKNIIKTQDLEDKPFTLQSSTFGFKNKPAARIIINAHDAENTPLPTTTRAETLKAQKLTRLEQESTAAALELAGPKSPGVGQLLGNLIRGQSGEQIAGMFQGLLRVFHPLDDAAEATLTKGRTSGWVRVHGEGMGDVSFDPFPTHALTLADRHAGKEAVLAAVKQFDFAADDGWKMLTSRSVDEIEARYIWAQKLAQVEDGAVVHMSDIPLLEAALASPKLTYIELAKDVGAREVVTKADLVDAIKIAKREYADILSRADHPAWPKKADPLGLTKPVPSITSGDIARAVNVSPKWLESEATASWQARQDAQTAWMRYREAKGIVRGEEDITYIPSLLKLQYNTAQTVTATTDLTSAMVNIGYRQKLQQQATDKAFARLSGELFDRFVHPGQDAILNSDRYGAGAGLFRFANGAYGTLASWAEATGKAAAELTQKIRANTNAVLDSVGLRLRNDQVAAIEFDKINNLVASTAEQYVLNPRNPKELILKKTLAYRNAVEEGRADVLFPDIKPGIPEIIKIESDLTAEAIAARITSNGSRVNHFNNLRRSAGIPATNDAAAFYPLKPQPRDYPFFAFVKDPTITGEAAGHTSMIHATDQVRLDEMIKMAQGRGLTVYTKGDTEAFFKAQNEYEWGRTLHENYIDSSLKSAGVNNQFFPKTNPTKIVDSWLELERRSDEVLAREAVSMKFGHEFDQLETLGNQYTNVASSKYGSSARQIEATAQNPYNDYRKTALNISRLSEHPLLISTNRMLERAVSGAYQRIVDVWDQSKTVNDLVAVNAALQTAGVNHAYKNAAEIILANHTAPRAYVSEFIRGANAILANTFLRLDPLNALNNAIGSQVLLGHETGTQVKALLRDRIGVVVPGTQDKILSPASLIATSMKNWYQRDPIRTAYYKANGWLTRLSDQYLSMTDDLTLAGTETPSALRGKLQAAMTKAREWTEKGELVTGNKGAEELNRFIAADVARQISDVRIELGLMRQDAQAAWINTFVNRTQGNILASQRPLIFQGPIGQAIGLFQTFQFNTMQQLFRSVAEGGAKDAAMAMGLQGTLYGLNGLPAFQFINQHIIGTASGNSEHVDAYSTIYGAAGKTAGDWLLYGIPSNILQTNLYTRGDINPRQLTIIPTNPADIVAVSAFAKFAGNLKETVSKAAGGGDVWQSILQGLEHNTLSRPLSGLAVTLQGVASPTKQSFSTTNSGDISFVNDLFSLATMSRLAGGKPLDEALANDQVSRSMVYKAADRERMKSATEKFKTNVIGAKDDVATTDEIHSYMDAFVSGGGRQEDFNRAMLQALTRVNTPRANHMIATLKGSYAESMKQLMGGGVEELDTPASTE